MPDETTKTKWWDRSVAVTHGQVVIVLVVWCALDFIAAIVRHLF